jgi:hypothetical protein
MPPSFPKYSVVDILNLIKRLCLFLGVIPVYLCWLLLVSLNAFADSTYRVPRIIRVGAYENQPKIYTDETGKQTGFGSGGQKSAG